MHHLFTAFSSEFIAALNLKLFVATWKANLPIATPTAGEYAGGTSTCGACGANVQEQLMLTARVTMVID